MKRVFLKGVNVVIDGLTEGTVFIPVRSARMSPESDHVTITDQELNNRYIVYWSELANEAGVIVADATTGTDYLSEFVGSFKFGGGVGNGSAIVVGSVQFFSDLPDPALHTGLYYAVQEGSGGIVIPLTSYRVGGNDPGLYLSNGTSWNLNRDLDATDIIVNSSLLNYSTSDKLNDVLKDIETKFGLIDGENSGPVSIHSDVDLTGVSTGDHLTWDGSKLIPMTPKSNAHYIGTDIGSASNAANQNFQIDLSMYGMMIGDNVRIGATYVRGDMGIDEDEYIEVGIGSAAAPKTEIGFEGFEDTVVFRSDGSMVDQMHTVVDIGAGVPGLQLYISPTDEVNFNVGLPNGWWWQFKLDVLIN